MSLSRRTVITGGSVALAARHHNGPMEPGANRGRGGGADSAEQETANQLSVGDRQKRLRRFWRSIPSPPRCKLCHRPFGQPGGAMMQLMGLGRWPGNPKYCRGCFKHLYRHRTGADIECSLIFADVRGSTNMAETMQPGDYRRLMDRFYATAFD